MHQEVAYRTHSTLVPLDVVVVMNTERSNAALRESVAEAVRARVRELASGDGAPWLDGQLWNPVDVRAFVVNAADGTLRSPEDNPRLRWSEANAVGDSLVAEDFAAAVTAEITATPTNDARNEGIVVTALGSALATAATPASRRRLVLVVSAHDDPSAPLRDANLRPSDQVVVVVPDRDGPKCGPVSAPYLEAWARSTSPNRSVTNPCRGILLKDSFADYLPACLFRGASGTSSSRPRCRVRAFIPASAHCDSTRGWSAVEGTVPSMNEHLAGMTVCEVAPLQGDDERMCRDGGRYTGRSSGWCLPLAEPSCLPAPRLVATSAPSWATIETVCNLE